MNELTTYLPLTYYFYISPTSPTFHQNTKPRKSFIFKASSVFSPNHQLFSRIYLTRARARGFGVPSLLKPKKQGNLERRLLRDDHRQQSRLRVVLQIPASDIGTHESPAPPHNRPSFSASIGALGNLPANEFACASSRFNAPSAHEKSGTPKDAAETKNCLIRLYHLHQSLGHWLRQ